jgi:hypothetical protein
MKRKIRNQEIKPWDAKNTRVNGLSTRKGPFSLLRVLRIIGFTKERKKWTLNAGERASATPHYVKCKEIQMSRTFS